MAIATLMELGLAPYEICHLLGVAIAIDPFTTVYEKFHHSWV